MLEQLEAFFEDPSRVTYLAARDQLARADLLPIDDSCMTHLSSLCASGEYELARELLDIMLPAWTLSPRFHYWSAVIAAESGDDEDAEVEQFLFQACLDGLLTTGDGSARSPYAVTYHSDISDVLLAGRHEAELRTLARIEAAWVETVVCDDQSRVHFDVTDLLAREGSQPIPNAVDDYTSPLLRSE